MISPQARQDLVSDKAHLDSPGCMLASVLTAATRSPVLLLLGPGLLLTQWTGYAVWLQGSDALSVGLTLAQTAWTDKFHGVGSLHGRVNILLQQGFAWEHPFARRAVAGIVFLLYE